MAESASSVTRMDDSIANVSTPVMIPTVAGGYRWQASLPFILVQLTLLIPLYTGVTWEMVALCVASYYLRMFGVTAGYHRYFAHRAYKTSRVFQFLLAFLAETSVQKGVLWWAWHHRHHHKHSDTEYDTHSPVRQSFFWSHMGWIVSEKFETPDLDKVKDLTKYPELVWLHNNFLVPVVSYAALMFLLFGWQGLLWGFFISTALLYHGTFTINSLSHVYGSQRYETGDASRNNFLLALITMGEGWHNNHHYYQSTANQGFFWYEIDMSYMILKVLSWFGIVWDLRTPPKHVLEGNRVKSRVRVQNLELPDAVPAHAQPAFSLASSATAAASVAVSAALTMSALESGMVENGVQPEDASQQQETMGEGLGVKGS